MKFFGFLILLLGSFPAFAQDDPLIGYWATEDHDGIVEFYPCENAFCGRFVWLEEDSAQNPSLDDKNVDTDLRGRPLCGMTFLGDYKKEGENIYNGGWIYSPLHGSRLNGQIRLNDKNTLVLRGYFIFSILGGEQIWQRVKKPVFCWKLKKDNDGSF